MADRPILIFPQPTSAKRAELDGGGRKVLVPELAAQWRRLEHKLEHIRNSFEGLQSRTDGLEPEQVIVFEAARGSSESLLDLARAAKLITGLEWLAEVDLDDMEPTEEFAIKGDKKAHVPRRLFALMSNQQAMNRLIGLWKKWQARPTKPAAQGFGPFKQLFVHLIDVRRWSARDRALDTGIEADWAYQLEYRRDAIRFEAELWYRKCDSEREQALAHVLDVVTEADGRLLRTATVPEIGYHGVLLECPPDTIQCALDALRQHRDTRLLACEDVMYYRPVGQSLIALPDDTGRALPGLVSERPLPSGEPTVAILDGLPLENHQALRGRLRIDDPDDIASAYRPEEQRHGTAMASLVVDGDLGDDHAPLTRPVYVRPVMKPVASGFGEHRHESFPTDELFVDLFHRAVRRIVEGDGSEPAAAPTVRIINVSLGNLHQPFIREMSALARLIDWLSWKYRLLFIVSTGNYVSDIELGISHAEYQALLDDGAVVHHTLSAMIRDAAKRRLLSPAESMNALTVGAAHADASRNTNPGTRIDLLRDKRLCSPFGTVSSGLHRAVKPDILMPGGRQLYHLQSRSADEPARFRVSQATSPPGQRLASPGKMPGDVQNYVHSRGTSNAAALTTRLAAQLYERLLALRSESGGELLSDEMLPALLKVLVVHGASWPADTSALAALPFSRDRWQRERERKARLFGFGEVEPHRVLSSTDQRVVLIGGGKLQKDGGHLYTVPMPPVLMGLPVKRRLVTTLAWLSPINPRHRKYRQAHLYLSVEGERYGFDSTSAADGKLAGRGTVQHLVYESRTVIGDDDTLPIRVSCREDAGGLEKAIPYGLAVTLEVDAAIPIYEQVRDRIRPRIRVGAPSR